MSTSMSGATGAKSMGSSTGNIIPKGHELGRLQNFDPQKMQLYQELMGQVGPESFLGKLAGGDQSQFAQLEAPALKQFSALQGNLASRFSGMGTGARRSSGFQNTSNQAAQDFASQLQAQRLGLQQSAIEQLFGMSSDLLRQEPYEQFLIKKQQKRSGLNSILGGSLPILGAAAGGVIGSTIAPGLGTAAGAQLGGTLGTAAGKAFLD